ncbi:MAG: hypothetical protein ACI909_001690 [Planctomycetota bacterium]|jgi:hypothetical protein
MNKAKLAGISLFIMVLLSISTAISPAVSPLAAAAFAWFALILLIDQLPRSMLIQASFMVSVGIACMIWSLDSISQVPFDKMLSANHKLLAVIAAVSFLRLITQPDPANNAPLPMGKTAMLKTLWGLHLFSSVITLSAMIIFGSRIEKEATITRLHAIMFSRTFAAGCFWSPFYVAIAVALLYAPGSDLLILSLAGIPVALFGLALTSWQFVRDKEIESCAGFPVHANALQIPIALSVLVIIAHVLLPDFNVLSLISILALVMTLTILLYQKRSEAVALYKNHIKTDLPRINREVTLFLAAGVMATGLTVLITNSELSLSVPEFTPLIGCIFILVSTLVSIAGVHPVITISVVGSLLSTTEFNPNLLGVCMMMMWGIGIVISPMSALNLTIQGRFGISSFSFLRWNAGYTVSLLIFSTALLYLYSYIDLI